MIDYVYYSASYSSPKLDFQSYQHLEIVLNDR